MTCSKDFGRLLQAGCLGLIGTLAVSAGCGGSETKKKYDGGSAPGDLAPPKPAMLNVSTGAVQLGNLEIGVPGTQSVVVTNVGGLASSTLNITSTPAGISTSGCSGTLQPGASCNLAITVVGNTAGAFSGSVSISATQGAATPLQVLVTANILSDGLFTLTPDRVDFGTVAVGETKKQTFLLSATGAINDLSITTNGADLTLDRTLTTCATAVLANTQCNVVITFLSTTSGAKNQSVTISGGGTKPRTYVVPITALVQAPPKLVVVPSPAPAFSATIGTTSSPVPFAITNAGDVSTGTVSIAITGAAKDSFVITANTCPAVLGAMGSCSVSVAYSPKGTGTAAETAALTLTDSSAPTTPTSVALTGTPLAVTPLAITPATGDMGSVRVNQVGPATVYTVTNNGQSASGALTVSMTSPEFYVANDTCSGTSLAAGGTCTLTVELRPTSAGAKSATLTVRGANAAAAVKMLTGIGTTLGSLTALPTSFNFGSVFVNQKSPVTTVTLTNNGGTATGALILNLTGAGAAQVATVQNTCTALAPAASCVIGLQYSPTDTSGVNGALVVTDDTGVSEAIPMVGTGLAPTNLVVCKTGEGSACGASGILASNLDMGSVTVGYTVGNPDGVSSTDGTYRLTVYVPATATSDSGTLTPTIGGTEATDFAVTNNNCTTLNVGALCTMDVTFTPGAAGPRKGTLAVAGSKGGTWTVQLTGIGLALVELAPVITPTEDNTQLDFGQSPNGVAGKLIQYKMIIRGATATTATTTTANVVLTTGSPADFRNVDAEGAATNANRCDGAALALTAGTGRVPTGATAPGNWAANADGVWQCTFWIQFYPQSGKSETPKAATVNATATAGGAASLALTGTATGPLVFDPDKYTFRSLSAGQASDVAVTLTGSVTLVVDGNPDGGVGDQTAEFTLVNKGVVNQGPFTVALDNTADFGIVTDGCTTLTAQLTPTTNTAAPYPTASSCVIKVVFAAAASATPGTKNATLTVTAGTETAKATITGLVADQAQGVDVNPKGTGTPPVVDLGSVAQDAVGTWTSFTISNPAGAALSGMLDYTVADTSGDTDISHFQVYDLTNAGVTAYPTGFCGNRMTKQLAGGESCIIQVRFAPKNTALPGAKTGTLTVKNGSATLPLINLSGTATSQLTASTKDLVFGAIAQAAESTRTTTLTNNGRNPLSLTAIPVAPTVPFIAVTDPAVTNACTTATPIAAGGTCVLSYTYTAGAPDTGLWQMTPSEDKTKPFVASIAAGTYVSVALNLTGSSVRPAALALYGMAHYANTASPWDGLPQMMPTTSTAGVKDIDLGDQQTSTTSAIFPIWFTNTGDVDALALAAELTGTNRTDFVIATEAPGYPLCATTLKAKAECVVAVRLAPQTSGAKVATLTLRASGLDGVSVNLKGAAHAQSAAVVSVTAVGSTNSTVATIAATPVNPTTPGKAFFTVRNNTSTAIERASLEVATATAGNGFTAGAVAGEAATGGTACGASIQPGAPCQIAVAFAPIHYGDNTADYERYRWATVTHNDVVVGSVFAQVQKPAKLELTATSAGGVTVTGDEINFGQVLQQQTATVTVTMVNIGETATAGTVTPSITGAGSAYLTVPAATNGCASLTSLAPNGSANDRCTFVVAASGTGTGLQEATLQGTGAADEASNEFDLVARLVAPALIQATVNTGALGEAAVGDTGNTATITVRNGNSGDTTNTRQDSGALVVTLAGAGADSFTVKTASSTCYDAVNARWKTVLAGDANTCTVVVAFTPASAGAKAATVTVGATPGGTAPAIALSGTGRSALTITPTGTQAAPVAMSTPTQTFVVTNVGDTRATGMLRATATGTGFVVTYDSCWGQSLSPGQVCTVNLTFTGTSSATTAQNATVTVTDGTTTNTAVAYVKVGGPA